MRDTLMENKTDPILGGGLFVQHLLTSEDEPLLCGRNTLFLLHLERLFLKFATAVKETEQFSFESVFYEENHQPSL